MKQTRKRALKKYLKSIEKKKGIVIPEETTFLYLNKSVNVITSTVGNNMVQISYIRTNNKTTCINVELSQCEIVQKCSFVLLSLCHQTDSILEISKEELLYIASSENEIYISRLEAFIKKKNTHMYDVLQIIKNLSYLDHIEFVKAQKDYPSNVYLFILKNNILKETYFCFDYDIKRKEILKCEFHCVSNYFNVQNELFHLYHRNIDEKLCEIFKKHPGVRMNTLFLT